MGGATANCYLTLEAAESYLLDRLGVPAWDAADDDDREASLMMATARLDLEPYTGRVVTTTQALQWPRSGVYNPSGVQYATDAIPAPIIAATCELAFAILTDPDWWNGTTDLAAFQNLRLGSLDMTPRQTTTQALPTYVTRLLAPYRVGGYQNRVVRA